MPISLDLLRASLKADLEDAEVALVQQHLRSATSACESFCNRKFYDTEKERQDDFPVAMTDKITLTTNRDTLLATLTECSDIELVWDRYRHDMDGIKRRCNGIVIDDTIIAAILWMAGCLYTNRSAPDELPMSVKNILQPYQWIGDLAWT
jgi:hypothetical protein